MEAQLHNENNRLTLVYPGTGAYTFDLRNEKKLSESALWEGKKDEKGFTFSLQFSKDGASFEGKGIDQDLNNIKCNGTVGKHKNRD